jgi:hypothetical protein
MDQIKTAADLFDISSRLPLAKPSPLMTASNRTSEPTLLFSLTECVHWVSLIHGMASQLAKSYVSFFIADIPTRANFLNLEIVGLNNNQIMGVSRRLLDSRRPREKPTKEAQEEGLIPYGPIPDERKMFLSYSLEVKESWERKEAQGHLQFD